MNTSQMKLRHLILFKDEWEKLEFFYGDNKDTYSYGQARYWRHAERFTLHKTAVRSDYGVEEIFYLHHCTPDHEWQDNVAGFEFASITVHEGVPMLDKHWAMSRLRGPGYSLLNGDLSLSEYKARNIRGIIDSFSEGFKEGSVKQISMPKPA